MNETAAPSAGCLPAEVSASVFYSATVSDATALLVVESDGGTPCVSWGNDSAARLLSHPISDLRRMPLADLVPGLADGGLALLLRERTAQVTVPVRARTGSAVECVLVAMPEPSGERWVVRLIATATSWSGRCGPPPRRTSAASPRSTNGPRSPCCSPSRACG